MKGKLCVWWVLQLSHDDDVYVLRVTPRTAAGARAQCLVLQVKSMLRLFGLRASELDTLLTYN